MTDAIWHPGLHALRVNYQESWPGLVLKSTAPLFIFMAMVATVINGISDS